jgi:outer membrane beta-barrel protein
MKTPSTTLHFSMRSLVLTMGATLAFAVPAAAADDAETADEEEAASDANADADPDAAASAGDEVTVEKPVLEETIFVVQGKPFLAQGRFELTPQFAQSVNDSFTSHTGLMVSGLYHLKENVAVEATVGAFMWIDERSGNPRLGGRDTDLTVELRQKENLAPERVKLYQFPYLLAANLQWSPMYGKVNIQDFVLGQFNLYLSVGAGIAGLQLETLTPGPQSQTFVELTNSIAPTTSFGGGLRFYFTDWLGVRVEVRDYVMPLAVFQSGANAIADADAPSFDVTNLILAQLGVSFVF